MSGDLRPLSETLIAGFVFLNQRKTSVNNCKWLNSQTNNREERLLSLAECPTVKNPFTNSQQTS